MQLNGSEWPYICKWLHVVKHKFHFYHGCIPQTTSVLSTHQYLTFLSPRKVRNRELKVRLHRLTCFQLLVRITGPRNEVVYLVNNGENGEALPGTELARPATRYGEVAALVPLSVGTAGALAPDKEVALGRVPAVVVGVDVEKPLALGVVMVAGTPHGADRPFVLTDSHVLGGSIEVQLGLGVAVDVRIGYALRSSDRRGGDAKRCYENGREVMHFEVFWVFLKCRCLAKGIGYTVMRIISSTGISLYDLYGTFISVRLRILSPHLRMCCPSVSQIPEHVSSYAIRGCKFF